MTKFKEPIEFEGLGKCFYEKFEYREPDTGEYYLSGAIVAAYRAIGKYSSKYWIVRPTYRAIPATGYTRGEKL